MSVFKTNVIVFIDDIIIVFDIRLTDIFQHASYELI